MTKFNGGMRKVDFKCHTFRSTENIFFTTRWQYSDKRPAASVLSRYIFTQTYIRLILINVKQNHGHQPLWSIFYIFELHIINL